MFLVAKRRKKTRVRDDGNSAAGDKPRRGKARLQHNSNEPPNPPQDAGMEGQDLRGPAPAQGSSPEGPRIVLPGEFYQREDRWWWRVKLPGEDRAKARPLKPEDGEEAVADRETAGKIAFEMWERAVRENAVRQIRLESTEKVERLKAQFLDKVRHFTELAEIANAKIEAETKARAEAEVKLAQMAQSGQPGGPEPETEELSAPWNDAQVGEVEDTTPAATNPPLDVGICECCEVTGVPWANLKRIDSGQLLCPRCLAALRADVARIEPIPAE